MTGMLSSAKRLVKRAPRRVGYRPSHGNYGMEMEEHLGGYWKGGDPHSWCPTLWKAVVLERQVRSVVDVGCGEGHSTRFFADLGLEVLGVEGGKEAIRRRRSRTGSSSAFLCE